MARGRFIVLEGLDGAGTTTQCAELARVLRKEGREVHVTNEPSQGPIGTLIRQALRSRLGLPGGAPLTDETMALLFAADRVDHLASEILPALKRGAVVLSDRYLLSSLAYQGSLVGLPWVASINSRAVTPDLTLFLEVPPVIAAKRRGKRGGKAELYERAAMQKKTARQYEQAIALRRAAKEQVIVIDGGRSVGAVTEACLEAIRGLDLSKGRTRAHS